MDLFKPEIVKDDYLIKNFLEPLFSYNSSNSNFLTDYMTVFVNGVFMLCGILFIFNIVHKTLDASQTGSLKTLNASTILRWVIGILLLIPIGSSGLGAGQKIAVWLAAQGVNLANVTFEKFDIASTIDNKAINFTANYNTQILNILKTATASQLCIAKASEHNQRANGAIANFRLKIEQHGNLINYNFGDQNLANANDNKLCGQISVSYKNDKQTEKHLVNENSLSTFATVNFINKAKLSNVLKQAHITATHKLITDEAQKIAADILQNRSASEVSKKLEQAIKTYNDSLKSKFDSINILNSDLDNKMKENGIAAAGAFFFKISLAQQDVLKVVNDVPQITTLKNSQDYGKNCNWYNFLGDNCAAAEKLKNISLEIATVQQRADSIFKDAFNILAANSKDKKIASAVASLKKSKSEEDFLNLFTPLTSDLDFNRLTYIDNQLSKINNPLLEIQALGQSIVLSVQTIILSLLAFSWSGAVTAIATVATPFLLAILIPGLILAFYLPLIPFITWIGGIFGWLILVVQAIFGVPLWLLAHLSPNSEGIVGRTGQGYMLILSLFLKPVLMFGGFIVAINLLSPITKLFNSFFGFAAESVFNETNSFLYVMYLISIMIIYCSVLITSLKLVFNLITEIPDNIFKWLGTNLNENLSNYAHNLDEKSDVRVRTATAHTTAAAGHLVNAANTSVTKVKDSIIKTTSSTNTSNNNFSNVNAVQEFETEFDRAIAEMKKKSKK
ncbi:DotA/TraY family protein [Gallibacterium anatis]|uniref:DotA/TraY family protein n=12 Tax=Gallibacterium anatis TaxID=750 RepID=UPI003004DEDE